MADACGRSQAVSNTRLTITVEERFVRVARELIEEMGDASADRLGSQKMRDVVAAARVITGWYEPEQMALSRPASTLSRQQRRAAARRRR